MSEAARATSVPVPIAIPRSAAERAGSVVDPVSHHRHDLAPRAERLHALGLLGRRETRGDVLLRDSRRSRRGGDGPRPVARQDVERETACRELRERLAGVRLDGVGEDDGSEEPPGDGRGGRASRRRPRRRAPAAPPRRGRRERPRSPRAPARRSPSPSRPPPGTAVTSRARSTPRPRARAAARTALASGCSDPALERRERGEERLLASRPPPGGARSPRGAPPSAFPSCRRRPSSRAPPSRGLPASRRRRPSCAPRPVPTTSAVGVARPRAQGQATRRTDVAARSARRSFGSGPKSIQPAKERSARTTTTGTKTAATRSTRRWTGAFVACACLTSFTTCASAVSFPTRVAFMTIAPFPFTVAPRSGSPGTFSTGIDSPVTSDSSTAVDPSTRTPSVGTFSPGRTRRRSPARTRSSGTSTSPSGRTRRAFRAPRRASARIASPAFPLARSSRNRPRRTSATMTTAAS